jgi:hypothetical protein
VKANQQTPNPNAIKPTEFRPISRLIKSSKRNFIQTKQTEQVIHPDSQFGFLLGIQRASIPLFYAQKIIHLAQNSNCQLAALFKADIQKSTRWTFLLKITHKKGLGAQWADLIKRSRILTSHT